MSYQAFKLAVTAVTLAIFSLPSAASTFAAPAIVTEQELVAPVAQIITHANMAEHPKLLRRKNIQQSLIDGEADIGISSQRWSDKDIARFVRHYGYQPTELFFTSDAAAIVVNNSNPVTAITTENLRQLFGCSEEPKLYQWQNLTSQARKFEQQAQPFAITGELAEHRAFSAMIDCTPGQRLPTTYLANIKAMTRAFSEHPGAIAYTLYHDTASQFKALDLIDNEGNRYGLNHETILSGRYPLANVYYMYLNLPASETYLSNSQKAFIEYSQSEPAQKMLSNFGFIPLPEEALQRNRVTLNWEKPAIEGGYK